MNHYIKARARGINCYGDNKTLSCLQEMFPLHGADDQDIIEALNKHFNISDPQHVRFLQQACFKTPLADVAKVYEDFRRQKYPDISDPQISNYFPNHHFVALRNVQKWLDGLGQYPSLASADNMKQQIAEALLNISQQFGYIPNLQRFLLYYPEYFLKVMKFRNRFFEQRVQQTCELTYLNPKNCCFAGIIAAVQFGCPYMVARMVNMFLVRDGDKAWITQKKYPQQFKSLFGLFGKIAIAPWQINQTDLQFLNTNWDNQVYFDLITVGMFVMSMSTICLAMGLVPDEPCQLIPMNEMLQIKRQYDLIKYGSFQNKKQIARQIRQMILEDRQLSKQQVQQIESKQIQPYMKQIGNKLNSHELYKSFYKLYAFLGIPDYSQFKRKAKNATFFHKYRETIDKGLEQQRKSDKMQDDKYESFKNYCIQGSNMTYNNLGKKKQQNTKIFRKLIQVLTGNLCGYYNQSFDYKKNIKLNTQLSMPLKFYVRLLSISPLYINKQVLSEINTDTEKNWIDCFQLGHLAIMVSQSKAKLIMTSIEVQLCQ